MKERLRIAILTSDARGTMGFPVVNSPNFGTAIRSLLEGFEMLGGNWEHESIEIKKFRKHENSKENSVEPGKALPFEIHVISCTQQIMASPVKLAHNIYFHSLHVPKWGWLRTGYQGCVNAVRKKLKDIQPDLVHAQGTERDCALSAVLSPYPRVLTIHGNLRLIKKQVGFKPFSAMWLQSYLEGLVVPRFNGVICITNYTKDAVKYEVPKTWVVPNAVDPSFLALGEKRMRRHEVKTSEINDSGFKSQISGLKSPPVILCVANIDERKNQNAFIRALDPLAKKMSFEVRFFGGCGTSDYGREFRELIASRPWCHYGGMLGREELRSQFEQAALLALPTHEDNCPMVVLEAMASGVPVMASKVGGVPDLIDGNTTGLFCSPNEPETICSGVNRLLKDINFARLISETAHKNAMERFHPKVVAQRHLEIYRQVLNR